MDLAALARSSGLYDVVEPWYSRRQVAAWASAGRPIPAPSAAKREMLREYGRRFNLRTLVETGTYKADTVRALRRDFDAIHSIEIADNFYRAAVTRCRRQANATIHQGDSGVLLNKIVAGLQGSALFWLDAHHSGGQTGGHSVPPIMAELDACLRAEHGHVVLIDDMREFGSDPNYPVVELIANLGEERGFAFEVRDDVARLTPKDGHP